MKTFSDPYWQAAFEVALEALGEAECVLAPTEFLSADTRFKPIEFSWGLKDLQRLAWCCSKDDVHRLAPWLHSAAADRDLCVWANEVFVLGGNFKLARRADTNTRRHLVAWLERVRRYRKGVPAFRSMERAPSNHPRGNATGKKPRQVLVVGASGMGNVGDDLLAEALAEMLEEEGAQVRLSGPEIDPLRAAKYDAIVVGGGGLIYASRDGSNEAQNLGNYLKFGAIGKHFGIPVGLIGVGDQDHAHGIEGDVFNQAFARNTLAQFQQLTTRDADSSALLERLGANTRTGCDLLFHWADRARTVVQTSASASSRLALIGELYRYPEFAEGLADGQGPLVPLVKERKFDFLIMSDDDLSHSKRMCKALERAGASVQTVDLRDRDFDALAALFASYRGIITTRFHGLIFAALTGAPVLALDENDGKKARLLRDLGAGQRLLITGSNGASAQLSQAFEGQLDRIPIEQVQAHSKQVTIHRFALRALVGTQAKCRSTTSLLVRSLWRAAVSRKSTGGDEPLDASSLCVGDSVGLCWAKSTHHTEGCANLGDSLSAVMVAALSGRPVHNVPFQWPVTKLVAVGSIGHAISHGLAVVWGSGVSIRNGVLARNVPRTRYDVRAIRGSISAQHYRNFGITVPEIYGDPVWLLPSILDEPVEQKFELGIIPHIQDVDGHQPHSPPMPDSLRYIVDEKYADKIVIINTWHEPTWEGLLAKVRLIRSCKRIASQSFHGVVIAEAYGIAVLNFRYLVGAKNGIRRIDLNEACDTDPRVWEFYDGGKRRDFFMYVQRREERTDWDAVIRAIDERWEPFEFDAGPLIEAFPLPLAYNPLRERIRSPRLLETLRF